MYERNHRVLHDTLDLLFVHFPLTVLLCRVTCREVYCIKLRQCLSVDVCDTSVFVFQGAHSRIRAMASQTQQQNFNGPQQQRGPPRRSLPPPEVQQ